MAAATGCRQCLGFPTRSLQRGRRCWSGISGAAFSRMSPTHQPTANFDPLQSKPTQLVASGLEAVRVMREVEARGGHVCGMAQVNGQNGRWRLSIQWPEPKLFSLKPSDKSACFDQCFADAGQECGQGNGPAILGPRCPIHADEELAVGKSGTNQQDFEIFISTIVLDRNSQVRSHKSMVAEGILRNNRARCRARPVVYQ